MLFLAGSARKALTVAIGEHTGAYPSYQAAPSFAYLIGDYTLNRTGTLAGPKNDYLIHTLANDGYQMYKTNNAHPALPGMSSVNGSTVGISP